jgi:hypothetical protein
MSRADFEREGYDHERMTGQHVFECEDIDESGGQKGIIRESKLIPKLEWNSRDGVTFDAGREVLATYTVQVLGNPEFVHFGAIKRAMRETEENLNDLLAPEKYRVSVKEWDQP